MAVDIHQHATDAVGEAERKRKADERVAVWAFLWTLFAFKMATVAAIFWAAGGSSEATAILSVTTWPFLIVPAAAVAGPLLFAWRLRRVRRRRAALRRAEWMLD